MTKLVGVGGSGRSRRGERHRLRIGHTIAVNPRTQAGSVNFDTVQVADAARLQGVAVATERLLGETSNAAQSLDDRRGNHEVQFRRVDIVILKVLDGGTQAGIGQRRAVTGRSPGERCRTVATDHSGFKQVGRAGNRTAVHAGHQLEQLGIHATGEGVTRVLRVELLHAVQGHHVSDVLVQFAVLVVLVDGQGDVGCGISNQRNGGIHRFGRCIAASRFREDDRVALLAELEGERAADVLGEMDPDDAADLLREIGQERAEALLELMEPDDAEDVLRLMNYEDYSAGGMMTTEPIVMSADYSVADALAAVRQQEISPALASQIFIARQPLETPTGRFIGTVHYQRLLREPPSTLLGSIVDTHSRGVKPDATLHEVSSHLASYNMLSLPVVDANDRLLGAITVDDVLDHLLPENWRHDHREKSPVAYKEV